VRFHSSARRSTILGSGSAVAFARLFSLVCAAAQLPLLTRFLSPSEYSGIAVAIAIATYFSLLSAEPIILGFQRFPGSDSERFNYAYALTWTLSAVAAAGLLVLGGGYLLVRTVDAFAFVGWGIGIAASRLVSAAWLMWGRPWQYAWNLMASTGTRTIVLLLAVLAGWDPMLSLGVAGLASAAAALSIAPRIAFVRRVWTSRPWPVSFGLNLALASLAFTVLSSGNLLLLPLFTPSDRVGMYAAMTQVGALTSAAILGLAFTVLYPRLRLAWDAGHRAAVNADLTAFQLAALFVALVTVFLVYVADHFLLKFVVPGDFIDGAVLAPLIMATAYAAIGQISSWSHQFQLDAGRVARETTMAAFVGIVTTLGLTILFQEQGAAIGTASGFLFYLARMRAGTHLPSLVTMAAAGSFTLTLAVAFVPFVWSNAVAYLALALAGGTALLIARSRHVSKPRVSLPIEGSDSGCDPSVVGREL
jgi:O-antigen/teichoic acid export membrane protein